jgi:cyanate permease|tara:strand:- start:2312 stop:3559 length:1248 start_codon:yes stop_codon:yes gene_type:complete
VIKEENQADDGIEENPLRWLILAGVWLIYFSFGLTVAAMAPLVPAICSDLEISYGAMGVVLGAWPFVYILSALPCGMLLDRIGPRKALFVAAAIMALSGFLRCFSDTYLIMILAVAVFGLGGPLISIGAPKLIAFLFEGKDRGLAMGIYITGPGLGAVVALSITNSFLLPIFDYSWRSVIGAYALFTISSGCIWLLLSSNQLGRLVESTMQAASTGPIGETFRNLASIRSVQIVLAMSVGIFFFNHGLNNWLPEIIRSKGLSFAEAGYWAAIPTTVSIISALLIPRLATSDKRVLVMGLLIVCAGMATFLLHTAPGLQLAFGLCLQGLARGAMMTVALLMLVEIPNVGPKRAGAAGGLFFTAAEIGGVTGPLVIGLLHDLSGGFSISLTMLSFICFLLLILLFLLQKSMKNDLSQ